MKQLAKSVSAELKAQQPAKTRDGNRSETCNCNYEILSGTHATPPENAAVEIAFFSTEECTPNNPFDCSYFNGQYFSPEICGSFPLPANCYDFWQSYPPNGSFQFDCSIPKYAQFDVVLNSNYFNPCPNGDFLYSSIVYRIVCVETCDEYWYLAYSNPDTLVFDPAVYGQTNDPRDWISLVTLTECGCKPVIGGDVQ